VFRVLVAARARRDGVLEPQAHPLAVGVRRGAAGRGRVQALHRRPLEDQRHRAHRVVPRRGCAAARDRVLRAGSAAAQGRRAEMRSLPLAALVCASAALAQPLPAPKPPEFTRSAELTLEGKGAIYALDLPVEVYAGLERRDLGDLRVQNAAAESVPHALVRPASSERKPAASIALPYFPLLGAPGRPVEDMTLRVERKPDGSVKAVVSTGERSPAAARR